MTKAERSSQPRVVCAGAGCRAGAGAGAGAGAARGWLIDQTLSGGAPLPPPARAAPKVELSPGLHDKVALTAALGADDVRRRRLAALALPPPQPPQDAPDHGRWWPRCSDCRCLRSVPRLAVTSGSDGRSSSASNSIGVGVGVGVDF